MRDPSVVGPYLAPVTSKLPRMMALGPVVSRRAKVVDVGRKRV